MEDLREELELLSDNQKIFKIYYNEKENNNLAKICHEIFNLKNCIIINLSNINEKEKFLFINLETKEDFKKKY